MEIDNNGAVTMMKRRFRTILGEISARAYRGDCSTEPTVVLIGFIVAELSSFQRVDKGLQAEGPQSSISRDHPTDTHTEEYGKPKRDIGSRRRRFPCSEPGRSRTMKVRSEKLK
jgi:hypothetical protein